MIEKKFQYLQKLMSGLDEQKLQDNKFDSISLISENLSRAKRSIEIAKPVKLFKTRQFSMVEQETDGEQFGRTAPTSFLVKARSLYEGSPSPSPRKKGETVYKKNKNRLANLAKRLYQARNLDMDVKESQLGYQEFLKTFMLKNSHNGQIKVGKVDLSGLGLVGNSMKVANNVIKDYLMVDLSRNLINSYDLTELKSSRVLQQLVLKNCGMKNEELCNLFKILVDTPIKILNISSPDIKDRNNLTKYDELYNFIEQSKTIQSLEMSNIQIHPNNQLFVKAKKSKTLTRLDLSKNTGVSGIYKNLTHLNLSWNNITDPKSLKCLDTSIIKLDLTGNQIPSLLFTQFLLTSNFPVIETLILNKVSINAEAEWIQNFLQKSKTLRKLSVVECDLSKASFLNIVYGMEVNKSLKSLNMSHNKLPKEVAAHFSVSISKSSINELILEQCDIKDESGVILFDNLQNNKNIECIDVSRNGLGVKTADKICQILKKGCYNLLVLEAQQNFMKYAQLKEIVCYMSRNVFMAKTKVKQQFKKYEKMNQNYSNDSMHMYKKISDAEEKIQLLRNESQCLQDSFMKISQAKKELDELVVEQKLRQLILEQEMKQKLKLEMEEELIELENKKNEQEG